MGKASLIGGVGAWVLAAALSLATAAYPESIKPHPHWMIALAVAGALMLLVPVIQWFYPIFKDKTPESFALDVVIADIARHRSPGPLSKWQHADVFIQASVHLRAPKAANVLYAVDLIRNGNTTPTTQISDVGLWHFISKPHARHLGPNAREDFYQNAQPLESSLSAKRKRDGWLHFRVPDTVRDVDITNSRLRLTVTSADEIVYTEAELTGSLFRPLMFQRKLSA
jgi:hypothetical protein